MDIKKIIEKGISIFKQLFEYTKSFVMGKVNDSINWVKEKKAQIDAYSAQSEKNKKRVRIYFILIVVVISYFAFSIVRGTIRSALSKKEAAKERIIPVYTYTTKLTSVTEQFKINGNVMAENSVNIMPDIGGKLVRYAVQVGDTVVRGQTVAYIDPSRPGTIYNLSPVPAPLDGTISSLPIELGNTVTTTTSVGQLGDLSQLKIETYVPERFVEMIHIGKDATVTTVAFPNDVFKAQIYELAPTLDPKTRTLLVKLRVTEGQGKLLSGMFSELLINARTIDNVLTVPAESIITRSGKKYVYVIDNEQGSTSSKGQIRKLKRKQKTDDLSQIDSGYYSGKAHMVAVETGIQTGNELIITKGLKPGDRVVYSGQDLLSENSLARILTIPSAEEEPMGEPSAEGLEETQAKEPAGDIMIDMPSSVSAAIAPDDAPGPGAEEIHSADTPDEEDIQETGKSASQANVQPRKKQPIKTWLVNIRAKIKAIILDLQKRGGLSPAEKKAITNPDLGEATEIIIEENPKDGLTLQALPTESQNWEEQKTENTQPQNAPSASASAADAVAPEAATPENIPATENTAPVKAAAEETEPVSSREESKTPTENEEKQEPADSKDKKAKQDKNLHRNSLILKKTAHGRGRNSL